LLGGCTSMSELKIGWKKTPIISIESFIDGMQYVRGSKADYDRYARVSGDPGWASVAFSPKCVFSQLILLVRWDAIQTYIRKVRSFSRLEYTLMAWRTSTGPSRRISTMRLGNSTRRSMAFMVSTPLV
jgi:choline dehydrogenase-like flavoprotein